MDGNFFFVNYFFYRGRSGGTYSDFVRESPLSWSRQKSETPCIREKYCKICTGPPCFGRGPPVNVKYLESKSALKPTLPVARLRGMDQSLPHPVLRLDPHLNNVEPCLLRRLRRNLCPR